MNEKFVVEIVTTIPPEFIVSPIQSENIYEDENGIKSYKYKEKYLMLGDEDYPMYVYAKKISSNKDYRIACIASINKIDQAKKHLIVAAKREMLATIQSLQHRIDYLQEDLEKYNMPKLYLRLFHGRTAPDQALDDWGPDGPLFGPIDSISSRYGIEITLFREREHQIDQCDLDIHEGHVYYDGMYYADFEIVSEQQLEPKWCSNGVLIYDSCWPEYSKTKIPVVKRNN